MKQLSLETLAETDLAVHRIEVFAESWTRRGSFALYEQTPRPVCALFLVCTDIRATFTDRAGNVLSASRGDVVFLPKGLCYSASFSGSRGVGIDTYTINFELYDGQGEELTLGDTVTLLRTVEDDRLEARAAKLCEVAHRVEGTAGRNLVKLHGEFFSLLDLLCSALREHSAVYYPIRLGADALRREWNQNERMEKYAGMCGISPAYFYRCFRAWSGQSPVEYRNAMRLSQAQSMLRNTDMRIGEIAGTVGFDDPFYFCRVFSARFGASPKEWRKRQRAEG